MAKPRIFISSTYYDLKYLRSQLESFVETLGYEAVLSERGDIPYAPNQPLDQSCYDEIAYCDIYVLIIGGRYGSPASSTASAEAFREQYDSVTKKEFEQACGLRKPIYVLVESTVHAECDTYLRNTDKEINY